MFAKRILLISFTMLFTHASGMAQIINKKIPDKLVVLTFDDAAKSHYNYVAPILKKYGFGASFFVCEFPPDFSDTTKYMNWQQIQALSDMGFEIGNHTRTHKHVNKMQDAEANEQLSYVESKCDSLHIPKLQSFAYPGYDTRAATLKILGDRGYLFARAGGSRVYDPLKDHPYLIPSFSTSGTDQQKVIDAIKLAKDGKVVVLTIHGVPDYAHDWVTTPPELFEVYMKYLHKHHYKVIALKDLAKYINIQQALDTIKPDWSLKTK
ncbi:polysaccharide deacetylase family protein [Pinibacter aurantiacus]|uniref:Polysaccharide deacetylase family protein n=1 Tax=Pinibacter aurantiacus TaxID=2851599 RepID=A0A9E2S6A0_9BACT|nr:polysaccharide deacetylase family protein [Pinibacter aurantiacus]MBV4355993.1 polysaccharide deacetylase family protein [Pinibacter aurantiacus]